MLIAFEVNAVFNNSNVQNESRYVYVDSRFIVFVGFDFQCDVCDVKSLLNISNEVKIFNLARFVLKIHKNSVVDWFVVMCPIFEFEFELLL